MIDVWTQEPMTSLGEVTGQQMFADGWDIVPESATTQSMARRARLRRAEVSPSRRREGRTCIGTAKAGYGNVERETVAVPGRQSYFVPVDGRSCLALRGLHIIDIYLVDAGIIILGR